MLLDARHVRVQCGVCTQPFSSRLAAAAMAATLSHSLCAKGRKHRGVGLPCARRSRSICPSWSADTGRFSPAGLRPVTSLHTEVTRNLFWGSSHAAAADESGASATPRAGRRWAELAMFACSHPAVFQLSRSFCCFFARVLCCMQAGLCNRTGADQRPGQRRAGAHVVATALVGGSQTRAACGPSSCRSPSRCGRA